MTDIEKFIECVKKYPILYNTRHKDFKNASKKAEIWEVIAGEMNETSEVLRTKWKGLKDGYTKYKNQIKGSTGSAKAYINWCWGPHLLFLDNFMKQRKSTSNIRTASQNIPTTPLLESTKDEISQGKNNILEQISPTSATPTPFTQTPSILTSTIRKSHRASEPTQSRGVLSKSDEDVERILNFMQSQHKTETDAVDDLFQSYAKTFKFFSIQTQTMLKVEMAKLFADAELREHMHQNQSPIHSLIKVESDITTEDNSDLHFT